MLWIMLKVQVVKVRILYLIPLLVDVQTDAEDIDENKCKLEHFTNDVPGEIEVHLSRDDNEIPLSDFVARFEQTTSNPQNKT